MSDTGRRRRLSQRWFVVVGIVVAIGLVVFVAPRASSQPDGLEKVAADHELDTSVREHDLADSPLADYSMSGVDDSTLSTALSGIIGIAVVFLLMYALVAATRAVARRSSADDHAEPVASSG